MIHELFEAYAESGGAEFLKAFFGADGIHPIALGDAGSETASGGWLSSLFGHPGTSDTLPDLDNMPDKTAGGPFASPVEPEDEGQEPAMDSGDGAVHPLPSEPSSEDFKLRPSSGVRPFALGDALSGAPTGEPYDIVTAEGNPLDVDTADETCSLYEFSADSMNGEVDRTLVRIANLTGEGADKVRSAALAVAGNIVDLENTIDVARSGGISDAELGHIEILKARLDGSYARFDAARGALGLGR